MIHIESFVIRSEATRIHYVTTLVVSFFSVERGYRVDGQRRFSLDREGWPAFAIAQVKWFLDAHT